MSSPARIHRFVIPALLSHLLLPVLPATAAENMMRPGLWEITTTSDLPALAGQIPPEQMQMIRNLAKQHGLDVSRIDNGAATTRICISEEMAAQKIPAYFHSDHLGCTIKDATRTGNHYKAQFTCSDVKLQGSGHAEGTFTSPESFSGNTVFKGTAQGFPVSQQARSTGRWISADCGSIRPVQPMSSL